MYEEQSGVDTVKQKLIIAGLSELQEKGVANFSLRRVASACNVSCAAPYKHFESKEHFISCILEYIESQWGLLADQVGRIFDKDSKKKLTETCIAFVRFWIANPNFRSILMGADNEKNKGAAMIRLAIGTRIDPLIEEYFQSCKKDPKDMIKYRYTVYSLIYGALLMMDDGELDNSSETLDMIREAISGALL